MSFAKISELLFTWLGEVCGIPISLILMFYFGFNTGILTRKILGGILLVMAVCNGYQYLNQKLYRREKLSTILPYSNLNAVFSIIAGFLFFRDTSLSSFIVALLTFGVILVFSIDFRKLTLPKSSLLILGIQALIALETLLTGRFLHSVSGTEYYILYECLVGMILLFPLVWKKQFKELKKTSLSFYGYRMGGALASHIGRILYLFTVSELGVVMSVLLSFLGTGITILFGRLFLKEKPTVKNIVMVIVVSMLVLLGFLVK